LMADSRLRALRISNAELIYVQQVICLKERRSLRVTNAFLEMIESSQKALNQNH